ncbi:MAG: hypothetical protein P9M01_01745 [Candidatus Kappaea frigidicola]|nr:hypothetical protein [Candidatus Kappaea frigidicola]
MLKGFMYFNLKPLKKTSQRAFSLVEVFVCAALVILVSVGSITAVVNVHRVINKVSFRIMAMNFAKEVLEELANRGYDSLSATDGYIAYEDALPVESDFLNKVNGQREYRVDEHTWGTETVDYKQITVKITWNDYYFLDSETGNPIVYSDEYIVYVADRVTVL